MAGLSSQRGLHLHAFASVALAVVVAVTLGLLGPGRPSSAAAEFTSDNALLVTNRDRLRVCVELSPALAPATAPRVSGELIQALQRLRQHPDWEAAGLGREVPPPERGCPGARRLTAPLRFDQVVGPGVTATPGPYRTAVFVLDEATARTVLGPRNATFAQFEIMCLPGGHLCPEVTRALLVRESFLTNVDFIDTYLTLAIGLRPLTPNGSRFPLPPGVKGSK
jgi:hypothetical protein